MNRQLLMYNIEQNGPKEPKEKQLRKLIKSLSRVSQVETKEIRQSIEKSKQCKNNNRIKFDVEKDSLLRDKKVLFLPNLLVTYKLFESKGSKVQSIKERYIESQAFLKRANFEYKKIQLKKQQIARKQHRSDSKYKPSPIVQKEIRLNTNREKQFLNKSFGQVNQEPIEEVDSHLMQRIKTTVHSSRKQIRQLYKTHLQIMNSIPQKKPCKAQHIVIRTQDSQDLSASSLKNGPVIKPTTSIIIPKTKKSSKSILSELIRHSTVRSRDKQQRRDTTLTTKQKVDHLNTENSIKEIQTKIQQTNRLKQCVVLARLKKLLYGDRKGRFIQDNTFKTRLKGQYSPQYMNIVKEQEDILNDFNGSHLNRRNLIEKFANILGTFRLQGKDHPELQVHQLS